MACFAEKFGIGAGGSYLVVHTLLISAIGIAHGTKEWCYGSRKIGAGYFVVSAAFLIVRSTKL